MGTIGERIKESRKQKAFTQQEVADQLHVSRSAVSNWEVGRNYPDLDLIIRLSDLLDITLDHLLREDTIMVQEISKEQRKGIIRKRLLQLIIPLFLLSLGTTGYFLYQEVDVVHHFFSPSIRTTVTVEEREPSWTPIIFEESSLFHLEGPFWKKEIINGAASVSEIEVRIADGRTGEELYQFVLKPGETYSIDELSKQTDYLVEVKGEKGTYFLTFL